MRSLDEQVRDEFYRWEYLGRGEQVWADFVAPEPHFVPFLCHGAFIERERPRDTGLRPSLFDRGKGLFSWGKRGGANQESYEYLFDPFESPTPPDTIIDLRGAIGIREFQVLLPEDEKLNPAKFEHLLYSLGALDYAVTFEIIAVCGIIQIQFVVDQDDADRFIGLFHSFFPEVSLEDAGGEELMGVIQNLSEGEIISRELALEREFFYPVRRFKELSVDPYQAIFGLLGAVAPYEMICLQFTFSPCRNPWGKSIATLVQGNDGGAFFENRPEDMRIALEKTSSPLFGVTVRLSGFAESVHRCRELLRPVAGSFESLQGLNSFVLGDEETHQDKVGKMVDVAYRTSRRSGMILNGNELMSLVHLPQPDVYAPSLVRKSGEARDLPDDLVSDSGLVLGMSADSSGNAEVTLSASERLKHMHVIGASGTGKSTFIANSIIQDLEAGHGLALLDPHGDLVAQVLDQIPEHRMDDVIIFDPADAEFPVGFNMLTARNEAEKNLLASDFVSIIQRLSSSWGDNMTSILGNAVMAFLESPRGGTLLDLRKFLNDDHFRNEYLTSVNEPEIQYFWTHEFPLIKGSAQTSLVTRIGSYIRQKLLRNMVAQTGQRLDFAEMLNEGKIFLAPLAQGLIGEECSFLLGSTLVSKFYQTALSRQQMDESDRKPFFLYVDEAHNFVTPSIASILSGTRKYGLGLILAHQDLDQFRSKSPSTLSAILTNAHTRVCFKLGDQDAKKLEEGFEHYGPQDLRVLGRGEALCRVGGSQNDFLLNTMPPLPVTEGAAVRTQQIIQASQERYGTPLAEVEKEMEVYYSAPPPVKKSAKKKTASIKKEKSDQSAVSTEKTKPPQKEESKDEVKKKDSEASLKPPEAKDVSESIEEEKPSAEPSLSPPEPTPEVIENARPYESIKKGKTPGRGGPVHKAMQGRIHALAMTLGLEAKIESELPKNGGKVDVLLEGRTKKIAIEIAHESPITQEVKNVAKCLPQNFTEIIVVSDEPDHLRKIRGACREAQLGAKLNEVKFFSSAQLGEFLSEFVQKIPSVETENLGYNIQTNFVTKPDHEIKDRKKRVHEMIAETRRKISSD